jgi:hypothetical protein
MFPTSPAFSAKHNDVVGIQTRNNRLAATVFNRLTLQKI